MNNSEYSRYFQKWIDTFSDDVHFIIKILSEDSASEKLKRLAVGALNYGLKQLDLIPDFYTPVGLIDDAFILRIFAKIALYEINNLKNEKLKQQLEKLADDSVIEDFAGEKLYRVLVNYVKALPDEKVRQRNAKIILSDPEIQKSFIEDLNNDLIGYKGATIENPDEVCKDLKSFLKMKLIG